MNIAVLYGGKSGEHEVSLRSASSVVRRIDRTKHTIILIGIAKDGRWYLQSQKELARVLADDSAFLRIDENPACLVRILPGGGSNGALQSGVNLEGKARKPDENCTIQTDIVLPVLHGSYGEDGLVQGLLEMAELPYCGCTALSSALAMDKEQTKKVWMQEGLQVVPFMCIKSADIRQDGFAEQSGSFEKFAALAEKRFGYPLFVKPACAGSSQRVKSSAEKAYRALDCSGLSRVDFFIDKKDGSLYLNEINTLPGFTSISMFPKMCEAAGLSYAELIELLLEQGLDRFKKRRALKTSFT